MAKATAKPRELEADLLLKAASRLQTVTDDWDNRAGELRDALYYNRRLWTIFATAATRADNPLPRQIKENIANLALFVFNRTVAIQTEPRPEKLPPLISINRELAAGLRDG